MTVDRGGLVPSLFTLAGIPLLCWALVWIAPSPLSCTTTSLFLYLLDLRAQRLYQISDSSTSRILLSSAVLDGPFTLFT